MHMHIMQKRHCLLDMDEIFWDGRLPNIITETNFNDNQVPGLGWQR